MSSAPPRPVEADVRVPDLHARRGQMEQIFDRLLTEFLQAAGVKLAAFEASRTWSWNSAPAAAQEKQE